VQNNAAMAKLDLAELFSQIVLHYVLPNYNIMGLIRNVPNLCLESLRNVSLSKNYQKFSENHTEFHQY